MIKIYGAGMAGLLAAHVLRKHRPVLHEAQTSLPHNHEALLRFRDDSIAEMTGIPFKKVKVLKGIWFEDKLVTDPNLRMGNLYSLKTNGTVRSRSIMDLSPSERWIAPKDFIERLSKDVEVVYGSPLTPGELESALDNPNREPIVSTIPMPMMMKMIRWPEMPEFQFKSIWAVTVPILGPVVDVYQTLYYPGDELFYRCSITGNKLIMEFQRDPVTSEDRDWYWLHDVAQIVLSHFGISNAELGVSQVKEQKFGKLVPIDDISRRGFVMALSELYGVYSLGRFATWKPNLLIHDVVEDARIVDGFIAHRDQYGRQLAMLKNRDRL